jgi:hypothetical protein
MKRIIQLTILFVFSLAANGFGQAQSQTFFSAGANILKSKDFKTYYDEECTPPTFFGFGVTHAWYRPDKDFTLNKEIGVNMQYSSPSLSSGGLGAHSYSKYQMLDFFAEATLQAQIKIDSTMSIAIGPAIEYLITGYNKENTSYYYLADGHYLNGEINHSGFSRSYFGDPIWGIKFSVFNFGMSDKATFKINCSYFWLNQDESNFHSSSFIKVGVAVGFGGKTTRTVKPID